MSLFREPRAKKALFIVAALLVLAALPFAQQAKKPKVLQSTNPELRFKGFEEFPLGPGHGRKGSQTLQVGWPDIDQQPHGWPCYLT